ncbi:hypothetical protein QQ045_030874 [Rhodiola kirilowii]
MDYLCDFCGDQRSMVYCILDDACLCLSCDQSVHSANALGKRHSRALLCERCNAQLALARCVEEKFRFVKIVISPVMVHRLLTRIIGGKHISFMFMELYIPFCLSLRLRISWESYAFMGI